MAPARVAARCQAAPAREWVPVRWVAVPGRRYSDLRVQVVSGYSSVWPPLCLALSVDPCLGELIPRPVAAYPPELLNGTQARTLYGPAQGEPRRL